MSPERLVQIVMEENRKLVGQVPRDSIMLFVEGLKEGKRVFCAAQGRSGFVLRCFCMRLMHLGYSAFFVGETTTPSIAKGDVLVILSGSGETASTLQWVKSSRQYGAKTYGIIGVKDSSIGQALDEMIVLGGGSKTGRCADSSSVQPPGSLFEQAAFWILEAIVLALYQAQGSDPRALLKQHANLE